MEHVKMKFKTVNYEHNTQFDAKMDELSFLGWDVLSGSCNSHSDDTLVERCVEVYQAILQRPVDYKANRIKELEELILSIMRIDYENYTPIQLEEFKEEAERYEAEISQLKNKDLE